MPRTPCSFPPGFVWGVASSAVQIEGAAWAGDRGPSIWDTFAEQPGYIQEGATPAVACDHYHRWPEDVRLLAQLGLPHYRFSVAWPRLFPGGNGFSSEQGLAYYDRLVDALLSVGVTPWVTLFHGDLPDALERRGGWLDRWTVDAFGRYAETVVRTLGDRVKRWITLNDIFSLIELGYGVGLRAPGRQESRARVNQAYHHALLAHGAAVAAVRQLGGTDALVGLSDSPVVPIPATQAADDVAFARSALRDANQRVLEPLLRGAYSERYFELAGLHAPRVGADDLELIAQPLDFLGLNLYTGVQVSRSNDLVEPILIGSGSDGGVDPISRLQPSALYWGPKLIAAEYQPPAIMITENGLGHVEPESVATALADDYRVEYLADSLRHLHAVVAEGVPVRGYFVWSFLDGFEGEEGYTRRYGLVHTNFSTQERTPKRSAQWYARVARANGLDP